MAVNMNKHRLVLHELTEKYKLDPDIRGILLYGSMAKGAESESSDIDLWIYRDTGGFVHSIKKVEGIKVDLFEISVSMLEKFLNNREAPAVNSLLEGEWLFNRDIDTDSLIAIANEAKNTEFIPISTMPQNRIKNVILHLQDLIDDAKDLTSDNLRFCLIFSEVIVEIYNNLYDFYGVWRGSPKETMEIFKDKLPNIYPLFYTMLDISIDPLLRVESAESILKSMAEKYGGIPSEHILTEIKNL